MNINKLHVLIACEESQIVTKAFRALGHDAYSCDIIDCSGGKPEWHIKDDVTNILNHSWDLIIAHPPCTYLTTTGNRWFDIEKYGDKAIKRFKDRDDAIKLVARIATARCEHIAIENPIGVLSTVWRKPNQIINPYQFGDPYEKQTCLWLQGLPNLVPTNIVVPEQRKQYKSGRSMPQWYADSWNLPKAERAKARSKTFPGIANAMATQWSKYLLLNY